MPFSIQKALFRAVLVTLGFFIFEKAEGQNDLPNARFSQRDGSFLLGENQVADASLDGQMIALANIRTLFFYGWDGRLVRQIEMGSSFILKLRWLPDGQKILGATFENRVFLADPATGEVRFLPIQFWHKNLLSDQFFNAIAPAPDGKRFAAAMRDGFVRVFSIETGAVLDSVFASNSPLGSYAVEFFPDGKRLLCDASGPDFFIYDLKKRRKTVLKTAKTLCINAFAVSRDGQKFALGTMNNDAHLELFEVKKQKRIRRFSLPSPYAVQSIRFSKNERRLVAVSSYFGASIFELENEKAEATFDVYGAKSAFWSPDERSICIVGTLWAQLQALEKGMILPENEPLLIEKLEPPRVADDVLVYTQVEDLSDSTQLRNAESAISEFLKYPSFTPEYPEATANSFNSAAWFALLTGNFQQAEARCRQGLRYDPANRALPTNLAPALLFQGKTDEAKKLYLELAPREFDRDRSYRAVFLEDLEAFEARSFLKKGHSAAIEKARAWLKK